MASGGSGKGSRGRGRRRQRGGARPGGGPGGGLGGGPRGGPRGGQAATTHAPRRGKAFSTPYEVPETGRIDPFDLFCACLMGLMPDGTYRGAGLGEVAKRFHRSPNELRQMLEDYGMDPETLKTVDFDLSLAKLDIQVAPEGIDRRELARGLFEEFCDLHPTLTCAPTHAAGNGGRPAHPHAHRAAPPDAEEIPGDGDEAPPEAAAEAGEGEEERTEGPEAKAGPDEVAEEEGDEAPEEAPLATADVGVARGGGRPDEEPGRPVRQIRRSPTRRGGG